MVLYIKRLCILISLEIIVNLESEINILWAMHSVHHSSETMSVVNSFRIFFFQDWLTSVYSQLVGFIVATC